MENNDNSDKSIISSKSDSIVNDEPKISFDDKSRDGLISKFRLYNRKSIYILMLFLVIFVITVIGILYPGNIQNNTINNVESNPNNPIIISKIGENLRIKGLLREVESSEDKYRYLLADQSGKTIAYLFSNNIDLSLSEGMGVEVDGQVTANYKGDLVVHVDELILK